MLSPNTIKSRQYKIRKTLSECAKLKKNAAITCEGNMFISGLIKRRSSRGEITQGRFAFSVTTAIGKYYLDTLKIIKVEVL